MKKPPLGLSCRAVVERVVDGDTMDVELRLPCRIRFVDASTPELNTDEGKEAKAFIERITPEGACVQVFIPTQEAHNLKDVMTFGRVLGVVWPKEDEDSLGDLLRLQGFSE